MPKSPKPKASKGAAPKMTPAQQSAAFLKTAKELEVDESGEAFKSAMQLLAPQKKRERH